MSQREREEIDKWIARLALARDELIAFCADHQICRLHENGTVLSARELLEEHRLSLPIPERFRLLGIVVLEETSWSSTERTKFEDTMGPSAPKRWADDKRSRR